MIYLLCVYFLFAGVTWVAGTPGVGILGRVGVGDLLLLPIVFWVVCTQPRSIRISRLGVAALVLLLAFTAGIVNSERLEDSLVEWLVHVYLVVGFITVYSLIASRPAAERFNIAAWWVRMAGVLALIGIYEFAAIVLGLPSLLAMIGKAPPTAAAVVGTFRNTGQAGMFFVTAVATAVPLLRCDTGRRKTEMAVWIAVLMVAMLLTVKRSALVASGTGLLLLFVMERGWRGRMWSTVAMAVAVAAVIPAFQWASSRSVAFESRVQRKFGQDVPERFQNFARSNVSAAVAAIEDHPLTGVGLGGVAGTYSEKYEIHSTYLSVPASTGLIGAVVYVWFILVLFRTMTTVRNGDPRAAMFARTLRPLMVGLMISFGYTYHLRKREFWITAAIATAIMAPDAGSRRRWSPLWHPPAALPQAPAPGPVEDAPVAAGA